MVGGQRVDVDSPVYGYKGLIFRDYCKCLREIMIKVLDYTTYGILCDLDSSLRTLSMFLSRISYAN